MMIFSFLAWLLVKAVVKHARVDSLLMKKMMMMLILNVKL